MRKIGLIVAVVMVLAAFAGCAQQTPVEQSTPTPEAKPESAPEVVEETPVVLELVVIKVAGSTSVGPVLEALAEKYMEINEHVTIDVEQTGSGAGVTSCGDGSADIGMASRDLKGEEEMTYPDMKATVLCLDGVAVVVNSANPVKDLTPAQISDIYAGKITNWKDVGGENKTITLYSRDSSSGTREAFTHLFLEQDIDDTKCIIVNSNGAMGTAVEGDATGIGYMSLGIAPQYSVTMLKVSGVDATVENLVSGVYTYYRNFNLLTLGDVTGEVAAFINYCLTDPDAVAYMESKGYVLP